MEQGQRTSERNLSRIHRYRYVSAVHYLLVCVFECACFLYPASGPDRLASRLVPPLRLIWWRLIGLRMSAALRRTIHYGIDGRWCNC